MLTNLDLPKTLSITYSLNRIRVSAVKTHLTHILLKNLALYSNMLSALALKMTTSLPKQEESLTVGQTHSGVTIYNPKALDITVILKDTKNYKVWVSHMKDMLAANGLYDFDSEKPAYFTSKQQNSIVKHVIQTNISEECSSIIANKNNPVKAWDLLKDCFDSMTISSKISSLQALFNWNLDSSKYEESLAEFQKLQSCCCSAIGEKITVEELGIMVFMWLLPENLSPIHAINSNSDTLLNVDTLHNQVHTELKMQQERTGGSAMITKDGHCKHNHDGATCWYCHPELAPICNTCKDTRFDKYCHKKGGIACRKQQKTKGTAISHTLKLTMTCGKL